jgi:RpiR family carbohydrate utilization transcriptional regulator
MLQHIQNHLDSFSPAERRVADWVLAHPGKARQLTLAELAEECSTSQPTVIRFCRHIGLAGFRELALTLTEALSRPQNLVHRNVRQGDGTQDVTLKVFDSAMKTLEQQRQMIQTQNFERATQLLKNARQIIFVGFGGSGHVAEDARHKFFRLGVPCSTMTNAPGVRQLASISQSNDVFVTISNSGQSADLIGATRLAAERGAHSIVVTDPRSELARYGTVVLACSEQDETNIYTPMNSRIAQLVVLDVLQVSLALALGDNAARYLQLSKQALQAGRST